jgi:ATP-binding cassette subfamily B protein
MNLTWPLSRLYISGSKLYDLNEILKFKSKIGLNSKDRKSEELNDKKEITPIHVTNLSFNYIRSKKQVLSNLNFSIYKNEKIAIVGANGAGKSTLIKIILGQYAPSSGSITWNGNLEIPSELSVVFQNFIKFDLSLRENIALGKIEEMNNDTLIINTLKKCDLYDLFVELGSLDIPLGHLMEGGRQLSGGQWQKIAIARAIFNGSDFIVFDEPTSAVDPSSEVEIFNKLMEICNDKTAIFISHRLGWAKNADRIIVMDNGEIVEIGTHNELMSQNGVYSQMFILQSSWYTKSN